VMPHADGDAKCARILSRAVPAELSRG
jgi:hypothetical protein